MMKSSSTFVAAALALLLGICPLPVVAAEAASVLGADGVVYTLRSGLYGDLFAGGETVPAANPVLALDIAAPDVAPRRLLVAGSADAAREEAHALVLDEGSGALYVAWSRLPAEGEVELRVVARTDGSWSEPARLAAEGELTAAPQLVVTRDGFSVAVESEGEEEQSLRRVTRTALHLLWAERGAEGERVVYAPLLLEDGVYLGSAPRLVLGDYDPAAGSGGTSKGAVSDSAPALVVGADGRSVVAAFVNAATGRQLAIELRLLPYALGDLAHEVGRYILAQGSEAIGPGGFESLAGGVGGMIIETGRELHPGVRYYFASVAQQALLDDALGGDSPGSSLQSLAGAVGGMIIEIGSRFFGTDGLDREFVDARLHRLEIPRDASGEQPPHLMRLYVISERAAPVVGSDASLLVSGDGESGVVWWREAEGLSYRESSGDEWTEIRTLPLGEGLSLDEAQRLLERRVQHH